MPQPCSLSNCKNDTSYIPVDNTYNSLEEIAMQFYKTCAVYLCINNHNKPPNQRPSDTSALQTAPWAVATAVTWLAVTRQ